MRSLLEIANSPERGKARQKDRLIGPNSLFPQSAPPRRWKELKITDHLESIKAPQPTGTDNWLTLLEKRYHGNIYGGWMENRAPLFDDRHVPEANLHLGLDFWLPEGTPILCPAAGTVLLSRPTNTEVGGWGNRLDILIKNHVWIFGHLKATNLPKGTEIKANQQIAELGSREENGGWLPHLHLQTMRANDYKALKQPEELDAYSTPFPTIKEMFPHPFKVDI